MGDETTDVASWRDDEGLTLQLIYMAKPGEKAQVYFEEGGNVILQKKAADLLNDISLKTPGEWIPQGFKNTPAWIRLIGTALPVIQEKTIKNEISLVADQEDFKKLAAAGLEPRFAVLATIIVRELKTKVLTYLLKMTQHGAPPSEQDKILSHSLLRVVEWTEEVFTNFEEFKKEKGLNKEA